MKHAGANGVMVGVDALDTLRRGVEWCVQVKHDGAYCEAHVDASGRVSRVVGKNGKELCDKRSRSLVGTFGGFPGSILCGEIEAHTEAGIAAHDAKGYANLHVFDARKIGNRNLEKLPYSERRDAMLKAWAGLCEATGDDKPWVDDSKGWAHDALGRFAKRVPFSWKRFPIVAQARLETLTASYSRALNAGEEGLVLVDQQAPMGKRRSKLKLKPLDSLDCKVVEVGQRYVSCTYLCDAWAREARSAGLPVIGAKEVQFTVFKSEKNPAWGTLILDPKSYTSKIHSGDILEVMHNGFYESKTPRFPRLMRIREDI